MDQRTRLLAGTDRLAESSRRLQDSHKIALETGMKGRSSRRDLEKKKSKCIAHG